MVWPTCILENCTQPQSVNQKSLLWEVLLAHFHRIENATKQPIGNYVEKCDKILSENWFFCDPPSAEIVFMFSWTMAIAEKQKNLFEYKLNFVFIAIKVHKQVGYFYKMQDRY